MIIIMVLPQAIIKKYYHPAESIFLEQPEPVLTPVGTQVELTCRVAIGYRIVWIVGISERGSINAEELGAIFALSSRGIETEISSAENREPTLTISGTVENNQITVQCRAVNITDIIQRCDGDVATIAFYGKTIKEFRDGSPLLAAKYLKHFATILIYRAPRSQPNDDHAIGHLAPPNDTPCQAYHQ